MRVEASRMGFPTLRFGWLHREHPVTDEPRERNGAYVVLGWLWLSIRWGNE